MNIVVLCGGISTERAVSINSGYNVCSALRSKGHNAILLDVYFGNEDVNIFDKTVDTYDVECAKEAIISLSEKVEDEKKNRKNFFGKNVINICQNADAVFVALHGKYGEDGLCQAAFDLNGIKYTGCGHLASAIGMDKGMTKQIFVAQNVPTAKSVWIKKDQSTDLADYDMKVPVVVKACNGGSSIGVVIVKDIVDYQDALDTCFKLDDQILIEEFIEGREFSVGVIDGKALPVVEIIPKMGWYDYENKYLPGATEDVCPAHLSEELTVKMQAIAEQAYNAIGCDPYARVDVMMDKDGNMYCLEVNTLPGMTSTSLIPQEAAVIGIDFASLCEMLVELSLRRYN